MSLYEIANDWKNVTTEEVNTMKKAVGHVLNEDDYKNLSVMCRKEWEMGTFIDVYVRLKTQKMIHLSINRSNAFKTAPDCTNGWQNCKCLEE